ncbi:hypothetical protein KQY30_21790 [Streptomyces sp. GMY02]|uniref:hypothetical protein n=1 Tax=Streptomyces sp. GMY02 TaxID=1333528 RepID=UPI001C2C3A1A|nr:hypothetical protein [Streptomyces sp. GMY02]QXE36471.1 hypothetical protein KQY30_21790 [Streptomyces sp. GMY02]
MRPKKRKRSNSDRVLSFGRQAGMACVALLLLVAGVWSSWGSAQHVVLAKGREHGTLTVTACADESCTGRYDPEGPQGPRTGMTIGQSVAVKKGGEFPVVVKPGTDELVRTGTPGLLYAWVPLGGALLLASLVIGGGMGLTRTAWGSALAGGALLVAAFFAV